VESRGPCLVYTARRPPVPEYPRLPLDPALSAYLLALPAFAGGRISLKGLWPADLPEAQEALRILRWAGLRVEVGEDAVTSVPESSPSGSLPPEDPESTLLPLVAAVSARDMRRNGGRGSFSPTPEKAAAVQGFFACLGMSPDSADPPRPSGMKPDPAAGRGAGRPVPVWICPDAYWGLALALASFVRPGVRLANPDIVTRAMPSFWPLFNSLADSVSSGAPPRPVAAETPPPRRRVRME
jgi:hypothetical protein